MSFLVLIRGELGIIPPHFICVGSFVFSNAITQMVVTPIERMMGRIHELQKNPLLGATAGSGDGDGDGHLGMLASLVSIFSPFFLCSERRQ